MPDIFDTLVKEDKTPQAGGDIFDRMAADPNGAVQVEDMTIDDMAHYFGVNSDKNNKIASIELNEDAPSIFDDSPETFDENFYDIPLYDLAPDNDPTGLSDTPGSRDPMGEILEVELKALGLVAAPFVRLGKFVASALAPTIKAISPTIKNNLELGVADYFIIKGLITGDENAIQGGRDLVNDLGDNALVPFSQIDWSAINDVPKSVKEMALTLIPIPGSADDVRTMGQVWSDEYYSELLDREAPWWAQIGIDVATEDLATFGIARLAKALSLANKLKNLSPKKLDLFSKTAKLSNKRLTSWEIKAGLKLYSRQGLAKLTPAQVRLELVKNFKVLEEVLPDELARIANPSYLEFNKEPINILNNAIKKSPRVIKSTEKLRKIERAKRFGKVSEARQKTGKAAEIAARKALKGELPRVDIDPLDISDDVVIELNEMIRKSRRISDVEFVPTTEALNKLIEHGVVPTKSRLRMLEKVFGPETIVNLLKKRRIGRRVADGFIEAVRTLNILQTTGDLMIGRQGWAAWLAHPIKRSRNILDIAIKEIKAVSKSGFRKLPKSIKVMNDSVVDTGHSILRRNAGVHVAEVGSVLDAGEELFLPKFMHKFLPLEVVENTNVLMMNTFRAHWFDELADVMLKSGLTWTDNAKDFKKVASFINSGVGRGDLPKLIDGMGVLPTLIFRSPRYMASKVTFPYHILTAYGKARKIVAKEFLKFLGTGVTIMSVVKLYGELNEDTDVAIELDPRSSDFGKVEVNGIRYDVWGGQTQVVRALARITSGLKKSALTDDISDVAAGDVIWDFIRPKFAPAVGLALDVYYKENSIGKPVDPTTMDGMQDIAKDTFIPFFIQDLIEISRTSPESMPIGGPLAFAGITVQAFEETPSLLAYNEREKMAIEYFNKPYSETDLEERMVLDMYIQGTRPDILELDIKAKAENLQIDSQQRDLELNRSSTRVRKGLDKDINMMFDSANMKPGGLTRRINNVKLNRDGYLKYEKLYIKWLNKLGKDIDMEGIDVISKAEMMTQLMGAARETAKTEMQTK